MHFSMKNTLKITIITTTLLNIPLVKVVGHAQQVSLACTTNKSANVFSGCKM